MPSLRWLPHQSVRESLRPHSQSIEETIVNQTSQLSAQGQLVGPVDHDVPVLSVRTAEGKLRAVVFGYACHATVLSLMDWSGDWPGFAQLEVEAAS